MKVGLLIIASEVLNGKIKDLNTHFLAEFLLQNHMELSLQMSVRDQEKDIHRALDILLESCDIIFTSGGVGPTQDDITKASLASYLIRPIVFSSTAMQVAQENYKRFGREYPGKDHVYSYLPEGFEALSNAAGFAPAYFVGFGEKSILALPGVPREFKRLVSDYFPTHILPKLKNRPKLELLVIRTSKVPEEKIFGEVDPSLWDKLSEYGEVSSLPVIYGVDITVKIQAETVDELANKRQKVRDIFLSSPIWPKVWHMGKESLEEVIIAKAKELNLTFGFAESATGGLCSERITNVSGASQCFFGSVVSYDTGVKEKVLGVPTATIENSGVVSLATAKSMAKGAQDLLGVDIAISITGIAGPGGGTAENPVGTVCIGSSRTGYLNATRYEFKGDRELLKQRFSQVALMTLLEEMEKIAH